MNEKKVYEVNGKLNDPQLEKSERYKTISVVTTGGFDRAAEIAVRYAARKYEGATFRVEDINVRTDGYVEDGDTL